MLVGEDGPGEARKKEIDAEATDRLKGSVVVEASELSRASRVQSVCDELSVVIEPLSHKGEPTGIEQIAEIFPEDQDVPEVVDQGDPKAGRAISVRGRGTVSTGKQITNFRQTA